MQGLRPYSAFVPLAAAALPADQPLRLVDIGWSGGLATGWLGFGEHLRVLGVTPDLEPAASGQVRLIHRPDLLASDRPWLPDRLADARARALEADAVAEPLKAWLEHQSPQPAGWPDPPGGLTALIETEGFGEADFLRLEGGPGDLGRLRDLQPFLSRHSLLGVAVRLNFFGGADPDENSLHNTDRLLREHGFDLFALEPAKFSSAALPWPFKQPQPADSFGGRALYAQAIYLRDPGRTPSLSGAALLKAAALRALVDLPDQAAEVLVLQAANLPPAFNMAAALDVLAAQIQEDTGTAFTGYGAYIAAFEERHPQFFDFTARHHNWLAGLRDFRREGPLRTRQAQDTARDLANTLFESEGRASDLRARSFGGRRGETAAAVAKARTGVDARSRLFPDHHWIFDHFRPYRGSTDTTFHRDFIGDRTLHSYGEWPAPRAVEDYESPLPAIDEEYFEWIDILQAALEAGPSFTMLELGAGYGRWSARGALAARQRGLKVRIGAAEAEPKHRVWLRDHLEANGLASSEYRIFDRAIGGEPGEIAFTVGHVTGDYGAGWFGQSIMPLDLKDGAQIGEYHGVPIYERDGWRAIIVPKIPLSQVLKPYDFIDLVDFDLQGAEGDAIAESIGALTRKARRLHIGTHSEDIEAQLRDLLPRHGWVQLRDYSLHKTHDTPFGRVEFVDGVQSWINPRLILRSRA